MPIVSKAKKKKEYQHYNSNILWDTEISPFLSGDQSGVCLLYVTVFL